MPISYQLGFLTAQLDPDLLSTPFGIQTKWHVITGAPCSGKTTLLDQLAAKGFHAVPETARLCFERELARGRTMEEIRGTGDALQRYICDTQLGVERGLRAMDVAFLDRALPDCLTFHRLFGLDPNSLLPDCFHRRYASIFILDRLPVPRSTPLGPEDDASAAFVDEWLSRDYGALGYDVVRVPALAPEERLAFVLERLAEQGLV
jgi:predicted ATPase